MGIEKMKPEEIFNIAIGITDKKARAAFLDKMCGDDQQLRAEVESLLKAHEEAGRSFLKAPPGIDKTLDAGPVTEGPGTKIGQYKLLQLIGEGGFGAVYMAEQEEPIRRRVALKIIKLGMDTKQVIARFEAERQALAMMDHPNIARVFDAGATDTGRPYFVMELVKGIPITEYCDKNNLDTRQRLELFIDVCKAVQHAHQKGIIHRDIKPSNVMITLHDGKPVPKIIDFGIAKATEHRLTEKTFFTEYRQFIGTPEYMSPEQAEMSGLGVDTRTDIYSLGVLLYELLTGTTPFEAKQLRSAAYDEIRRIICEDEPQKPSTRLSTLGDALTDVAKHRDVQPAQLCKMVRGDLDWVVMKSLEKDRTRRYETAKEFAVDIERHLGDEPVSAGPPGALYRMKKFVRRNRALVTGIAAVLVVLLAGIVVSTIFAIGQARARSQADKARSVAEEARTAEAEQRKLVETKAEDLRRSLYVNSINLADSKYKEGNIARVCELLNSCPNDLRGWEWHRLNYISDQAYKTFHGRHGVWSIALSPNGRHIASGDSGGIITLWDTSSGTEILTFAAHVGRVHCVSFSPDGKRIVSGGDDKLVKVWDAASGNELMSLSGHDSMTFSVAFSPDGKQIVSSSLNYPRQPQSTGQIKVWDASTGKELLSLPLQEDSKFLCVKFSPDSARIVAAGANNVIEVFDAATGDKLMTLQGHKRPVFSVAFSPDGKQIASGSDDNKIKLWDAQTGNEVLTLAGHKRRVRSVAFSPDGRCLVSGSDDTLIKIWDITTGKEIANFRGHRSSIASVVFTPDGKKVVSGSWDGTIKVWDVTRNPEVIILKGHDDFVSCVTFSPDGRNLATASHDKTVRIWDVANRCETMILRGHDNNVRSLAYSPDGKHLASGSTSGILKVWDTTTGKEVMSQQANIHEPGKYGEINSICFSPDGSKIFVAGGKGIVKVYEAISGKEVMTLSGLKNYVWCVRFSPDGKLIASGAEEGIVKIYDANSGAEVMDLSKSEGEEYYAVYSVAFSPDGKQLVTAGEITKVWDLLTGKELMRLHGYGEFTYSVVFTKDGKRLIGGCGSVKVWDVTTGAEVMTLDEGDVPVWSVAISPNGRIIAGGSEDGSIRIWEAAGPEEVTER